MPIIRVLKPSTIALIPAHANPCETKLGEIEQVVRERVGSVVQGLAARIENVAAAIKRVREAEERDLKQSDLILRMRKCAHRL